VVTVVGTVAFDALARVKALAEPEATGGILEVEPEAFGGTGGNVSFALARLGARPRLVAGVGADFAGSAYESALRTAGVDLSRLARVDEPTSRAYIFYDGDGRQVTYFYPGAARALARADVRVEGRVHFAAGEISCYPRLMRQAEWVSFDPGQETFHRDLDQIVACLEHVDLLFVNRHELARLQEKAGLDVPALLDAGVGPVVETRGAEGCTVHAEGSRFVAPAIPVPARDPTGAGDAHRAGFLYALERGADMPVAARFANVLGSFAVETVGAQAGLPTLVDAAARYEKAYGVRPFA
jgi:sugar/nucleoside kinase (ribokinase family)